MGSVYLINAFVCLAWAILHPGRNGYEETRQSFIRRGYTGETDEYGGFLLKVRCERCHRSGWCSACQRDAWANGSR
jgi:hypothetical protein